MIIFPILHTHIGQLACAKKRKAMCSWDVGGTDETATRTLGAVCKTFLSAYAVTLNPITTITFVNNAWSSLEY